MLSWASRLTLAFTGFFPWPGAHLAALRDTIYEWHVILISHPFSYSWTHFFRSFRGCACQNKHFHMVVIAPGLCVAMWQKKGMEHSVGERVFRGLEWGHFFSVECRLITNRCKVPQWCLKRGRHSEVLTKRRKLFVFRRLWVLKMYTPYRCMYTHICMTKSRLKDSEISHFCGTYWWSMRDVFFGFFLKRFALCQAFHLPTMTTSVPAHKLLPMKCGLTKVGLVI